MRVTVLLISLLKGRLCQQNMFLRLLLVDNADCQFGINRGTMLGGGCHENEVVINLDFLFLV